jgi:cytochrome c oxidase subunit 4
MSRPPIALLLSWVGLLALLALTIVVAYQPLGSLNTVIAPAIAGVKMLIIAATFMKLRERGPLVIAFAVAGLFWLAILFWLGSVDFFSRAGSRRSDQLGGACGSRHRDRGRPRKRMRGLINQRQFGLEHGNSTRRLGCAEIGPKGLWLERRLG